MRSSRDGPKALPNRGWRSLLHGFRRDDRGAYAVEFGLLALPFFGLLFAIVEVSWVSFNSEQLQAAVSRASRQVMTGTAQQNYSTPASFVSNLLCPTDGTRILPNFMDCSKLIVDARTAADFKGADMTGSFYSQGSLKYCLGQPNTVVVLRVVYPMESIFPLSIYNRYIGLANNVPNAPGWKHVLLASAVFETEPYQGNYTAPPTC